MHILLFVAVLVTLFRSYNIYTCDLEQVSEPFRVGQHTEALIKHIYMSVLLKIHFSKILLVILKLMLQNNYKLLKKCFIVIDNRVITKCGTNEEFITNHDSMFIAVTQSICCTRSDDCVTMVLTMVLTMS